MSSKLIEDNFTQSLNWNSFEGYVENLACQYQGNPLFLKIHSAAQVAEICLPVNRGDW